MRKTAKYLICVICVALLHACASTSEPVKYYSLALDPLAGDQPVADHTTKDHTTEVVIPRVHLTKLLQQDGIVTRTGENEIRVAHSHRWAEPLDETIVKLLVRALNARGSQYHFSELMPDMNQHPRYTLRLSIDRFDIVDDGSVAIAGRFWLLDKNVTSIHEQSFNIGQRLDEDGYPQAVEKLKQALLQLADKILVSFDAVQPPV